MNKLYAILIATLFIGTAGAAIYTIINPVAHIEFAKSPETINGSTVMTLINCGNGYAIDCQFGMIDGDTLVREMYHRNMNVEQYDGAVVFGIECEQGIDDNMDGTIRDFKNITYTDPTGTTHECNVPSCIEWTADGVTITPPAPIYGYVFDVGEYTNLRIVFDPTAFGNYTLSAQVIA